jgi:hypothetical protein
LEDGGFSSVWQKSKKKSSATDTHDGKSTKESSESTTKVVTQRDPIREIQVADFFADRTEVQLSSTTTATPREFGITSQSEIVAAMTAAEDVEDVSAAQRAVQEENAYLNEFDNPNIETVIATGASSSSSSNTEKKRKK